MGIKSLVSKNKENEEQKSKQTEIIFIKNIVNDSYAKYVKMNSFTIFNSIYDILILIYSTEKNSIIFYNMIDNKKIVEIKNAHITYITNFRHYLDINNKRDLIISISLENNIKLWNVNNYECLLNIKNINGKGRLFSACFLNDNNQIFILTSNIINNPEPIKIFDLEGKMVKIINNSNDSVHFIDTYNDIKKSKIYILTCNKDCVKSYDYMNNKIYQTYRDLRKKDKKDYYYYEAHICLIINNKEELIESCNDGNIRIWNFHSGELLKIIRVINENYILECFCSWNNDYLLVVCGQTIKIIQLKNGKIVKELNGHNQRIIYITTIFHPKYGKSIITQGFDKDGIKLWANKLENDLV